MGLEATRQVALPSSLVSPSSVTISRHPSLVRSHTDCHRTQYNTRGNRGYESLTPWAEADGAAAKAAAIDAIPGALQASLHAYYSPFNRRLFELTGARCEWVESNIQEEAQARGTRGVD